MEIKYFWNTSGRKLTDDINEFIKDKGKRIVEIKILNAVDEIESFTAFVVFSS